VVLAGAALAVGGFYLYRAASPMIDNVRAYGESLSRIGELEKDIQNRTPYTAPANDELTPAQVDRFVNVQEQVRKSLGARFDQIEQKYQHLKANATGPEKPAQPTFMEAMAALGDVMNVFVEARRFQVEALNQQQFSQAEYSWVRDRVYRAAGVEFTRAVDLQKIAEALRQNTGINSIELPETKTIGDAPARNLELVKPHMDKVKEWIPLAFFGL
jgi:hypothetical protein